jgi:hypothetical protein
LGEEEEAAGNLSRLIHILVCYCRLYLHLKDPVSVKNSIMYCEVRSSPSFRLRFVVFGSGD